VARDVDYSKCRKYVTSGSTGVPITVFCDEKTEEFRAAIFARPFLECGLRITDKMVRITDSEHWYRNWYERLGIMRKICISPDKTIEENLTKVQEFSPDAIFGHSSYIFLLAKAVLEEHRAITPRLVIGTADLLTRKIRNFVNSTFNVEMFDFYGSAEVERMAWECSEHVGYHIDMENIVLELVDDDGENVSSGERGNVVVTSLHNYAMPFIRYNMGDSAVLADEKCPCVRGLPLLKSLDGRTNDFFRLPGGELLPPTAFLATLDYIPGVFQYRVVQESPKRVLVELVKGDSFSDETIERFRNETMKIVGDFAEVEVSVVKEIPRERSGKTKVITSKI
jgi:phenylacetate-CoA ligase